MAAASSDYPNINHDSCVQLPYYSTGVLDPALYADEPQSDFQNSQERSKLDRSSGTVKHAILPSTHPFFEAQKASLSHQNDTYADQEDNDFEPIDNELSQDHELTPSPHASPSPPTDPVRGSKRPRGRPRSGRGVKRSRGSTRSPNTPRKARKSAASKPQPSHSNLDHAVNDLDDDPRLGRPRGQPRKAPDPGPEYRQAQGEANEALLAKNYEDAKQALSRAIRINPEIFIGYISLSEIAFLESRPTEGIDILFVGAFTMYSNLGVWRSVLETLQQHAALYTRLEYLEKLHRCYANIIRLDPSDIEARHSRIAIFLERGQTVGAQGNARAILRRSPFDLRALSVFAHTATDQSTLQEAVKSYEAVIDHLQNARGKPSETFAWSDLDIYIRLYVRLGLHDTGLVLAKRLSRWLLGRKEETFWDAWTVDDREFDELHEPRRIGVPEFIRNERIDNSYGMELPPEIRAKLGILRLQSGDQAEAMMHFEFFEPDSAADETPSKTFPQPVREIVDALVACDETFHACRFFSAIFPGKEFSSEDTDRFRRYAETLVKEQQISHAIEAYARLIRKQPGAWQDRLDLARLYEQRGNKGDEKRAFLLVREVLRQNRTKEVYSSGLRSANKLKGARFSLTRAVDAEAARRAGASADAQMFAELNIGADASSGENYIDQMPIGRHGHGQGGGSNKYRRLETDKRSSEAHYGDLYRQTAELIGGERGDISAWLDAAVALTDKYLGQHALSDTILNMTDYKPQKEGVFVEGVSSAEWLGIICQTCLVLAAHGDAGEVAAARTYLINAERVPEFFTQEEHLQQIHLCQVLFGALTSNEDGMTYAMRWWTSSYGHMSDIYALSSLMSRYLGKQQKLQGRGSHQKYWLRHLKAQDFALMDEAQRNKFDFKQMERRGYSRHPERQKPSAGGDSDPSGNPEALKEFDPSLFSFYGDMMSATGSFSNALNYYMRAQLTRPDDPVILLSITSAYVQLSLKRTTENRQWDILTALGFFKAYAKVRRSQAQQSTPWLRAQREMEVCFNEGRVLHSLGLAHLAYPAYERCLEIEEVPYGAEDEAAGAMYESDFRREAALGMQNILVTAGNVEGAREISERWLVF